MARYGFYSVPASPSEGNFTLVSESAPMPVSLVDEDGNVTSAQTEQSPVPEDITGTPAMVVDEAGDLVVERPLWQSIVSLLEENNRLLAKLVAGLEQVHETEFLELELD